MTFTPDDIKRLAPENPDEIQAWLTSHLKAHREAAQALLTTRLQLEIAIERLEHIAARAPNTQVDLWYMNQANVAIATIKELNHG